MRLVSAISLENNTSQTNCNGAERLVGTNDVDIQDSNEISLRILVLHA